MLKLLLTTTAAIWLVGCSKTPAPESVPETPNTLTDSRDGQTYRTVKIGGMTWMAQNLNYRSDRYWDYGYEDSNKSWCYDGKDFNCDEYGRLYDWETAMTACPAGWHLPSRWELDSLGRILGSDGQPSSYGKGAIAWRGAGKKLKAKHSWSWDDYNNISGNGTDDFGFSALSGGYRDTNGDYHFAGIYGVWWTAAERRDGYAYYWGMINHNDDLAMDSRSKGAFSVRCVQDAAGWFLRRDTPNADSAIIDEINDVVRLKSSTDSLLNLIKNMKPRGSGFYSGDLELKRKADENKPRESGGVTLGARKKDGKKCNGFKYKKGVIDDHVPCNCCDINRSRAHIQNVIIKNYVDLRRAYVKRLGEKPGLAGSVTVTFEMDGFGKVTFLQVMESTMDDINIEKTFLSIIKGWDFGAVKDTDYVQEFTHRFVFAQ
jgi:uncharacterized protein (TIGR02145 family)